MSFKKICFVLCLFSVVFFIAGVNDSFSAGKSGKIVYSTKGTGSKIWVMNEDGTDCLQLTYGPGIDGGPEWSPDGNKIAFSSNRESGYFNEIFVMNADGTNMQKVVSISGANCAGQEWTPDGKKLGFSVNFGSNDNCIYWVNVDGTGLEPIYDAHSKVDFCSFSADGNKILFIHWGKLYIMNIDGTGKTQIGNAQRADWLPNQDLVVYVDQSTYRDIWIVNPVTLERQQFTFEYPTEEFFLDPKWSWPDAQKIVYNRAGDLWIMNGDGSNKIQLTFDGLTGEGSGELYYFDIEIQALIDIKPETLNRKSKGKWVTVFIELPESYDPGEIDLTSIVIFAVDGIILEESLYAELFPTKIKDYNANGIPDLMVKFNRRSLIELLSSGVHNISISGNLNDGTIFEGNDTLKVIH
jgi:hypothetical protein